MASAPFVSATDGDGRHACPARQDTGMRAPQTGAYDGLTPCRRQTVVPGRHAGQTHLRAGGTSFTPTSPPAVFLPPAYRTPQPPWPRRHFHVAVAPPAGACRALLKMGMVMSPLRAPALPQGTLAPAEQGAAPRNPGA